MNGASSLFLEACFLKTALGKEYRLGGMCSQ